MSDNANFIHAAHHDELETAARHVIDALRALQQYQDDRIVVVGGLARWHYVRGPFETTTDVDFAIELTQGQAINTLKQDLDNSSNALQLDAATGHLVYPTTHQRRIRIDFVLSVPYTPPAAMSISQIGGGPGQPTTNNDLPYLSLEDLVAFKFHMCGQRRTGRGSSQADAKDVRMLLRGVGTPLHLNQEQWDLVQQGMPDIVEHGHESQPWFEARLVTP